MIGLIRLITANRLTKIDFVSIDNFVFKLHYRFTFMNLVISSVFHSWQKFLGKPIECIIGGKTPRNVVEAYCWTEGTFTLSKALLSSIGKEVSAPGVATTYEKDEIIEHRYYQWVSLALFIQGMCFYLPHFLWKAWEGKKIQNLQMNLNDVIMGPEEKSIREDILVTYLKANMGRHSMYAYHYFLCEVLNLINLIIQMVFVNYFLGGEFYEYGINFVKFAFMDTYEKGDPMVKMFPKLTKCTFHQFGYSGDVEKLDFVCLLALNNINEKIYIVLWFWFSILLLITGLTVFYSVVMITIPQIRNFALYSSHRSVPERYFDNIFKKCNYGDWFLLSLLSKNLFSMHYRDVIVKLSDRLDSHPNNGGKGGYDIKDTEV